MTEQVSSYSLRSNPYSRDYSSEMKCQICCKYNTIDQKMHTQAISYFNLDEEIYLDPS